jgi:hypothetical protein
LGEIILAKDSNENEGIKLLLEYYRNIFRTAENMNYYSSDDFQIAERKFLKFKLIGHSGPGQDEV